MIQLDKWYPHSTFYPQSVWYPHSSQYTHSIPHGTNIARATPTPHGAPTPHCSAPIPQVTNIARATPTPHGIRQPSGEENKFPVSFHYRCLVGAHWFCWFLGFLIVLIYYTYNKFKRTTFLCYGTIIYNFKKGFIYLKITGDGWTVYNILQGCNCFQSTCRS